MKQINLNEKSELKLNTDILLVLAVISVITVYYYGLRALLVIVISVATCTISDFICYRLRKIKAKPVKYIASVITGILLALMMPATVSYHVLIIAALLATIIGRQAFGGHGNEIFNPSAVGLLFAALSFPESLQTFPKVFVNLPISNIVSTNILYPSANRTLILTSSVPTDFMDIMIGKLTAPMGTTFFILLLLCSVILIFRKTISAICFLTQLCIITIYSFIYFDNNFISVLTVLNGGMILFGLIFLSCNYKITPQTTSAKIIFSVITAFLVILFEFYAKVEYAVVYAVIISAPLCFELNKNSFSFKESINKINAKRKLIIQNINVHSDILNEIILNGGEAFERENSESGHKSNKSPDKET